MKKLILNLILCLLINNTSLLADFEIIDPQTRYVHDPTMIYADGYYYVFCTGDLIDIRRSDDLVDWEYIGSVFDEIPTWVQNKISGVSNLWAPDVTYHNGKYYLCYSASTFGSQTSLIALLSNETLDPDDPDYEWVDEGEMLDSPPDSGAAFNAIDGTFVKDENNDMWLVFGSWWEGIMLTPLDNTTLMPTTSPPTIHHLARRSGSSAMEAAYITYRNGYYYLFVNWDVCCSGVDSTYKIMVGRSMAITGPYYDKNGDALLYGSGGSLFAYSDVRWIGPGHATITTVNGQDYFSYHAYDAEHSGTPTLRVNYMSWDDDFWPVLGYPVNYTPPALPNGPTVAHWNFEDGVPGQPINNTGLTGQIGTVDLSENSYDLYSYDETSGPSFSSEGQTPTGIGLSARFDSGQDAYTYSESFNYWSPNEWTIELAVNLDSLAGWQTLIGKDGSSQSESASDFYLQKNDANDKFRINFNTVGGQRYVLDADFTVEAGKWYYIAVVSDGTYLKMYADKLDGNGSVLVGSLTMNTNNNNALPGAGYNWTVGRGWYDGRFTDHIAGNIDDIRFSNTALSTTELINYECGAWGYWDFDLNTDCVVNLRDFAIFGVDWDLTLDQVADFADQWLGSTMPYESGSVNMYE